jgi:uncharacterized DUF497 family protein
MEIEFDADKDTINRAKHGVPLTLGLIVLENVVSDVPDPRDYGTEERRSPTV